MMHVILRDGLEDRDYLQRYTEGWERLPEQVRTWTPARTAAETGLTAAAIEQLAQDFATTRPAFIRLNYGMQRHAGGGMAVRAISLLPAITGAWREVGGGATLSTSGAFHFDTDALTRPDWIRPGTRTINMVRLGEALTDTCAGVGGPPVKALVVYNSNPGAVAPDLRRVREGLRREDLFTVVLEHFQTDTADYADWLLPATTQLEHWDIHASYGHLYVTLNRPAIEPVGESLPNAEIFRRLAAWMGLTGPEFGDSDVDLIRQALASGHPSLAGISFERLVDEGHARVNVPTPFAPLVTPERLETPSGKIQIYSPALEQLGLDPLPAYVPPEESGGDPASRYPLTLLSPPEHPFLNSTFVNVPALAAAAGAATILLHPDDAAERRIEGGQKLRIWNDRGDFLAVAVVTEDVRQGVVVSYGVRWAKRSEEGRTVNDTTSQRETDLGGGAVFYDNAVQIELYPKPAEPTSRNESRATNRPAGAIG